MLREPPKAKGRPRRKPVRGHVVRNKLAEENARLVTWAVMRFFRKLDKTVERSYSRDDARGDAWTGFLRACELWEPARGALSAYAWYWMRQEMQQGLQAALNMIRSPSHHPEIHVPCTLKDEWPENEVPADRGEDVIVVIIRSDVLEALDAALDRIQPRQAAIIRMRLSGSTWTEVAKELRVSIPCAKGIEQEGLASLRKELEFVKELV